MGSEVQASSIERRRAAADTGRCECTAEADRPVRKARQNHFTKWSELIELANKAGKTVRDALWNLFVRIGMPTTLQTDNGGEFVNATVKEFIAECMINFIQGTPYHPQTQGSVESANKTLRRGLNKAMKDKSRQSWPFPRLLALVQ